MRNHQWDATRQKANWRKGSSSSTVRLLSSLISFLILTRVANSFQVAHFVRPCASSVVSSSVSRAVVGRRLPWSSDSSLLSLSPLRRMGVAALRDGWKTTKKKDECHLNLRLAGSRNDGDGGEADAENNNRAGSSSVFACAALVAGTTVGAGIIALPAKTLEAGFVPSALTLLCGWAYMASTGLLIAEVNVNTLCTLDVDEGNTPARDAVSVNTMAEQILGHTGAKASSLAFLFLHYALLTAYIIQGGSLLIEAIAKLLPPQISSSLPIIPTDFDTFIGPALFATILGGALFGLSRPKFETLNNALVLGVIATFVALLGFGIPHVQPQLLQRANYGAILNALPLMPVVYVFQTVVPTVCSLLKCDLDKIRTALLTGTAVPLLMFLSWSAVVLGTVPYDDNYYAASTTTQLDPLEALRGGGDSFGNTVLIFSLLAVATSFLGFSYGLVDFFADLFQWDGLGSGSDASTETTTATVQSSAMDKEDAESSTTAASDTSSKRNGGSRQFQTLALFALSVLPPVAIAVSDPSLFFEALDNAGAYGILVLFGILPAAMTWVQRYGTAESDPVVSESVPGGRASLVVIFVIATFIIGLETYEKFIPVTA